VNRSRPASLDYKPLSDSIALALSSLWATQGCGDWSAKLVLPNGEVVRFSGKREHEQSQPFTPLIVSQTEAPTTDQYSFMTSLAPDES
jgi:hypothetical protein